jgi:hypothetical protein
LLRAADDHVGASHSAPRRIRRDLAAQFLAPHVKADGAGSIGAKRPGEIFRFGLLEIFLRVALGGTDSGEVLTPGRNDVHSPDDLILRVIDVRVGDLLAFFFGL